MREIEFRGKTKTADSYWVVGSLVIDSKKNYFILDADETYPVIPETVGQYIGLKDMTGAKIYEGQRVRVGDFVDGLWLDTQEHRVEYCADIDYPAFDLVPHIDCDSNGLSYVIAAGEEKIEIIPDEVQPPLSNVK